MIKSRIYKGKPYIIYSFTLVNSELKPLIHKGIKPSSVKNLTKINAFWRGWDKELNEYMFHKSKKLCNDWESVPEYDYRPPMNVTVQIRKSESVDKTTPSLYFLYINLRLNKYISRINTRILKVFNCRFYKTFGRSIFQFFLFFFLRLASFTSTKKLDTGESFSYHLIFV